MTCSGVGGGNVGCAEGGGGYEDFELYRQPPSSPPQTPPVQAPSVQCDVRIDVFQPIFVLPPQPECACAPGWFPAPDPCLSGTPAGRGLCTRPEGWPEDAIRTAGGYTIVPEGQSAAWSIYAPGQQYGEKAHTRIWGDPHVDEKDGTRWDFTKSSDFVLPDGTRIHAKTTSETGRSVTAGLTICNGADRIEVNGVNTGAPEVGPITHDGYGWRAQHAAANPGRDTFRLTGDQDNVHWFKEQYGASQGRIEGAHYDSATQQYVQRTNRDACAWIDPSLRPPLGSPAWGQLLRGAIADQTGLIGGLMGSRGGRLAPPVSPFGGLGSLFPGLFGPQNPFAGMADLLTQRRDHRQCAQQQWQQEWLMHQMHAMALHSCRR